MTSTDHNSVRRVIEHESQEVETLENFSSRQGVRLGNKTKGGDKWPVGLVLLGVSSKVL